MLTGVLPFHHRNPTRQNQAILNNPVQIPNPVRVPHSDEFADLVNRLLDKDPVTRLQGAEQVLNHPWFTNENLKEAYIDIERIKNKVEKPVAPESFFEYNNMNLFSIKKTNSNFRESNIDQ